VWRYLVDTTESIKPGHPVVIWRVDVVFLTAAIGNMREAKQKKARVAAHTLSESQTQHRN
jgi:hypothetical protein